MTLAIRALNEGRVIESILCFPPREFANVDMLPHSFCFYFIHVFTQLLITWHTPLSVVI